MAEVVGIILGVIPLTLQIVEGSQRLRKAFECAGNLSSRLDVLANEAKFLNNLAGCLDSSVSDLCAPSLKSVTIALDRLNEKANNVHRRKGIDLLAPQLQLTRNCQRDLAHLETLIRDARSILTLGLQATHIAPKPQALVAISEEDNAVDASHHDLGSYQAEQSRLIPSPKEQSKKCASRRCRCRCHIVGTVRSRFWSFDYTPLSMVLGSCDVPDCTTRHYTTSFRVAFSQLGLNWAFAAAIGVQTGGGSFSVQVNLRPQCIVRNTSEGFLLLFNIKKGLVSLEDGISEFRGMYRRDPNMIHHVNPSGQGYIEELLRQPAYGADGLASREKLLRLFIKDFRMTQGLDELSFLYSCVRWIGEGPHLALFDVLLDLGFNPGIVEFPRAQKWPLPCDGSWRAVEFTEDPFFIDLMSALTLHDRDFCGLTALQHDILHAPAKAMQVLKNPNYQLDETPNFLGQTPLHLAVAREEVFGTLLNSNHAVDATDAFGLTPLMYAAGLNKLEIAKMLLSAGADPEKEDPRRKRTFVSFAFTRGHYDFIVHIVQHIQSINPDYSAEIGQFYGMSLLCTFAANPQTHWRLPVRCVKALAKLTQDINIKFSDPDKYVSEHGVAQDNHLLHYKWPYDHAKAIFEAGFTALNERNSLSETALMYAAISGNSDLSQYYVGKGAKVNDTDWKGRNALAHALRMWSKATSMFGDEEHSYLETAKVLLHAGTDLSISDSCDCPCSASGCSAPYTLTAVLTTRTSSSFRASKSLFVTVEWLHLLEEYHMRSVFKEQILMLIRRALFEKLKMTHTCCQLSEASSYKWSQYESPVLSEDERSSIRAQQLGKARLLEQELESLADLEPAELMHRWQITIFDCHLFVLREEEAPPWPRVLSKWNSRFNHRDTLSKHRPAPLTPSTPSGLYTVDQRQDCICENYGSFPWNPLREDRPLTESIRYIASLEKSYTGLGPKPNHADLDAWYTRRLQWVIEFLELMKVSSDYQCSGLQRELELDYEAKALASSMVSHFQDARKAIMDAKTDTLNSVRS